MKNKLGSDTHSIELHNKYLCGNIRAKDYRNYTATRYGFNDINDFNRKERFVVLSMIQSKHDYVSIHSETAFTRVKQLYKIYKDTILQCACCNEHNLEFLTIDHINNDGAEHRRKLGIKNGFYRTSRFLLRDGFSASDYQVLCMNCNYSLGNYGYCPHNPEITRENNGEKIYRTRQNKKLIIRK